MLCTLLHAFHTHTLVRKRLNQPGPVADAPTPLSDLKHHLTAFCTTPSKHVHVERSVLCMTAAGNVCELLTLHDGGARRPLAARKCMCCLLPRILASCLHCLPLYSGCNKRSCASGRKQCKLDGAWYSTVFVHGLDGGAVAARSLCFQGVFGSVQ
jgi:hypothetical protein